MRNLGAPYQLFFMLGLFFAQQSVGFTLMTTLYNEQKQERIDEYIFCINENLKNPLISTIHILYQGNEMERDKILNYLKLYPHKIKITYITTRPTFGDIFELANQLSPGSAVIVCNADIFFNETLSLLKNYDLNNKFISLTRWNLMPDGSLDLYWLKDGQGNFYKPSSRATFDAWIFKTPLRKFSYSAIPIGTWNCDGALVYQAYNAGLTLLNPCMSVQACHVHASGVHNYKVELIAVPLLGLEWCKL